MYFKNLPDLQYDFFSNGLVQNVPDILRQARVVKNRINAAVAYHSVIIKEERPDQLSTRLYGTPNYWWTFFIVNDKLKRGMLDWPLSQDDLDYYIEKTYPDLALRMYRQPGNDIHFNSIHDKLGPGALITGLTSGATARVVARDLTMNTVYFNYIEGQFEEWEEIFSEDIADMYVDCYYHKILYTTADGDYDSVKDQWWVRPGPEAVHHYYDHVNDRIYRNYENYDLVKNDDPFLRQYKTDLPPPDYVIDEYVDPGQLMSDLIDVTTVTNREYEIQLNDERRKIRVIRPEHIDAFATEFRKALNE